MDFCALRSGKNLFAGSVVGIDRCGLDARAPSDRSGERLAAPVVGLRGDDAVRIGALLQATKSVVGIESGGQALMVGEALDLAATTRMGN
jgi:hypothetical protein